MLFCHSLGKGTCQWNGAGRKKDPGRLFHNKKTSHTYPWNLYGKTHLVSFIRGFGCGFFPKPVQDRIHWFVKTPVSPLRDLILSDFPGFLGFCIHAQVVFPCLWLLRCTLKTLHMSISSNAYVNRKIF